MEASPLRVTMLNKYYPPHLGGIEFHMRDLAEDLASRPDVDVSAIVANEGPRRVEESAGGVHVTRLPRQAAWASTPIVRAMAGEIRRAARADNPPDLVHLHFPYPWGEVSWLAANEGPRGANLPTVMTYHSDIVRQKAALAAYRPVLDRVLDRVDLIIASSPNMVEHSKFLSQRADKCRVVPFGIRVEEFEATPERTARAAELVAEHAPGRGARPIVLFVGRLIYYKGADILARAMADLDADLVVVGTGPLESTMREIAVANGSIDRIAFLGTQPFPDLVAWYHAADVFALPSVARSEAFGLVQLEAHAAGTPVVSTDLTTGVPFANKDGETGFTVPVGDVTALHDALARLTGDSELRARLGKQALERVRRELSIPRMTAETLDVYREAIELRAARAGGRGART